VIVHLCLGGNDAGGSFPVDDLSSSWRATKSLYRLLTVHVRIGVETGYQSSGPGDDQILTLYRVCSMWLRLCDYLCRSDYYVLDIGHCSGIQVGVSGSVDG
jgi:hypothetical protein